MQLRLKQKTLGLHVHVAQLLKQVSEKFGKIPSQVSMLHEVNRVQSRCYFPMVGSLQWCAYKLFKNLLKAFLVVQCPSLK